MVIQFILGFANHNQRRNAHQFVHTILFNKFCSLVGKKLLPLYGDRSKVNVS